MNTKKIMLIEDDPDIVWLTQLQLKQAGYQVHTNTDGTSGLAEFLDTGADLLLLDIDLPGLGGWEVYSHVREVSPVPIIMLTAYPLQQSNRPNCFGQQHELCLGKPFSFGQLRTVIDAMLSAASREPVAAGGPTESSIAPVFAAPNSNERRIEVDHIARLFHDESGIQHAEEALLLAVLAVALVGAVGILKNGVSTTLGTATNAITATYP